jgi:hypothetical protein
VEVLVRNYGLHSLKVGVRCWIMMQLVQSEFCYMNLWTKAHSSVIQHFHSNLAHYNLTQYGGSESVVERESRVLVAAARRCCTQKVQLEGALSPVDGFASTYAVLKTLSPLFSMAALRSEGSSQAMGHASACIASLSIQSS